MKREFTAGQSGFVGGMQFRIVQGRKTPRGDGHDLRIDLRAQDWVAVGMPLVFLLIDFLCENEDVLFPPPRFRGGQMLMDFIHGARTQGWEIAAQMLADQRQRRAQRDGEAAA